MAVADRQAPPAGIAALANRYDPDVIDIPGGSALVRLRVEGWDEWDARLADSELRLAPARDA
jgi:hypothetical protein